MVDEVLNLRATSGTGGLVAMELRLLAEGFNKGDGEPRRPIGAIRHIVVLGTARESLLKNELANLERPSLHDQGGIWFLEEKD